MKRLVERRTLCVLGRCEAVATLLFRVLDKYCEDYVEESSEAEVDECQTTTK